jgi:hypothetical protein
MLLNHRDSTDSLIRLAMHDFFVTVPKTFVSSEREIDRV